MPLFDAYVVVDWSAANVPAVGANSIWMSFAEREENEVRPIETVNVSTRAGAMAKLRQFFRERLDANQRVFAGFDFPFGYPRGGAEAISGEASWQSLWSYFAGNIQDLDSNLNNRFEIAGRLNRDKLAHAPMFWGRPEFQDIPGLSPKKPEPYPDALAEKRIAEGRTDRAQPVWKMHYTGSVGSQAMTGIAQLERLRGDEEFAEKIAVWPFETRFTEVMDAPIVLAEIYPSLFDIQRQSGRPLDADQVETLAEIFAKRDIENRFKSYLSVPADLSQEDVETVVAEEGWIVGLGWQQAAGTGASSENGNGGKRRLDYLRSPEQIYAESFRQIREAIDLSRFDEEAHDLVIRIVHACGIPEVAESLTISEDAVASGRAALEGSASVIVDSEMVAHGVIRSALPAENKVVCRLNLPKVREIARRDETTRSAAQIDLWNDVIEGSVVAIGNAPTALFRLLEKLDEGGPKPALIIGLPVGFVGAAEAKAELKSNPRGVPFITLDGRLGGSAMAAAAVNALSKGLGLGEGDGG
ncbi:precorrin-8X methylmutase [Fulvimarina pelagi HTCC2506]|uniref:Precorrin-8X methylmutase n=1 Tax=Fulvimarina pelagi HTCC2506 TaxID=314231 RepID=Q0G5H8_9HYPH|nr:precorrin-8X methylmutase [Fulvimarina pelagi]EAU43086.1 precorrin-8X methylmutase [Fulvimarina pelagi HTCC2506]